MYTNPKEDIVNYIDNHEVLYKQVHLLNHSKGYLKIFFFLNAYKGSYATRTFNFQHR